MTGQPSDAIQALLPGYALNALDEEEREQVERALEDHPPYRAELADYLAVVALLSTAHEPVTPSHSLRERVLGYQPSEPPVELPVLVGVGASGRKPSATEDAHATRRAADRRRFSPLWGIAAVLTAAVLGLGSFSWMQYQQMQDLRKDVTVLASEAGEMEHRLVAQQALTLWVAQPGVTTVTLRAVNNLPVSVLGTAPRQAVARGMIMRAPGGESVLVAANMPELPEYYSYQAWAWDGLGQQHSLGVFEVDASGYAQVLVDYPRQSQEYHAVSITVEPAGGSVTPSSATVLTGVVLPQ
jgi:anti-sigma factor RsiW